MTGKVTVGQLPVWRSSRWRKGRLGTEESFDRQSRHYFTELGEHFRGMTNFDLPKAFILSLDHE